ncbi:MAG: hypothetical protein IJ523_11320 [Succinivibrionaceae bacterium]|nr:hypothetical protein [Succinivibrionaceae bacterium]
MDRTEALRLVEDRKRLCDLVRLNAARSDLSEEFRRCVALFPSLAEPEFSSTFLLLNRLRPDGFISLKSEQERLLLVEPAVVFDLIFFLGACIVGARVRHVTSQTELSACRRIMGYDIFSFVYFYAVYALYAEDLGIQETVKSCAADENSIRDMLLKAGCLAVHEIARGFSSEQIRQAFFKRVEIDDYDSLCSYFRISPVRPVVSTGRLYHLAVIFLHSRGID